jgi:hypothetical protein
MTLPPPLTWLTLLPATARVVCDGGAPWFRETLAKHAAVVARSLAAAGEAGTAAPRVHVVCDKPWHELAELSKWDTLVAINCPGVTTKRLETAGFAYARRYAVLPSLQSARWFINLDAGKIAAASFSVYTPARRSAHLKKAVAKLLARLRLPYWYKDQVIVASRAVPATEAKLSELFPGRAVRIGLSAGAPEPARNRKASGAIIGGGGEVLGFVKIAGSPLSRSIMEHEAEVLSALAERQQLRSITAGLLFAGEIDGRYVTVQSPLPGKPAPAKLTAAHLRYLATLRVGPTKPAAATQMVAALPGRIAALHGSGIDLGAALDDVMPALETLEVPSTIVHGDFAPWNLRVHGGAVSAFDWEYGELDGPPLIDETHFRLQLGFQMKGWTPEHAALELGAVAARQPLGMTPPQVRALHVVYLIDQIARLLGEGYPADDEMVAWDAALLGKLSGAKREAVLA